MKKILVLGQLDKAGIALLEAKKNIAWVQLLGEDAQNEAKILAHLKEANALLVRTQNILPAWIKQAKNLEIVSRHGVGVDNLPLKTLSKNKIPVCIIEDINSISVAEHTVMLLLSCAKQLRFYQTKMQNRAWHMRDEGRSVELYNKNLLMIGCGRVGEKILERLAAFKMQTKIFDPHKKTKNNYALFVTNIEDALSSADFVLLCCPKTKETINILNKKMLNLLKSQAILINTARGALVDENALYDLLRARKIAAAGFDVFATEPMPKQHPLLLLDNFIATPHIASKTKECIKNTSVSAVNNILRFWQGDLNYSLITNSEVLK